MAGGSSVCGYLDGFVMNIFEKEEEEDISDGVGTNAFS